MYHSIQRLLPMIYMGRYIPVVVAPARKRSTIRAGRLDTNSNPTAVLVNAISITR